MGQGDFGVGTRETESKKSYTEHRKVTFVDSGSQKSQRTGLVLKQCLGKLPELRKVGTQGGMVKKL